MLRIAVLGGLVLCVACDSKKPDSSPPATPAAPAATDNWVAYVHPQKLFSARFPAKPAESDNKADSVIGPVTVKMAIASRGPSQAYAAMSTSYDLPKGSTFDVQKALDGAREGMLGKMNGKVTSEKPSKLDGYDGRELAFEGQGPGGKTMKGQARVYVSAEPPAAYLAFVIYVDGNLDDDAKKFLDSVHVGKGVDAK